MKTYQRLLIFLVLVLALTALTSPWLAAASDWVRERWPTLQSQRYPFSRIFNRTFMVCGIILFFVCRRLLRVGRLSDVGLPRSHSAVRDLITGWSLAVLSLVCLAFAMNLAGVFTMSLRFPPGEAAARCMSALFAGWLVALLEEIFFRGIIFKGLLEDGKPTRAFVLANLFYAALHFIRPGEAYFLQRLDPLAGFYHLLSTFHPFLDPVSVFPGLFGLFLIGVVLSYAFIRTKALYLAIGLHAGWIFSLKTIRVFGTYNREDLGWVFGSSEPKLVSGGAAWIGMIVVAIVVGLLTRRAEKNTVEHGG